MENTVLEDIPDTYSTPITGKKEMHPLTSSYMRELDNVAWGLGEYRDLGSDTFLKKSKAN